MHTESPSADWLVGWKKWTKRWRKKSLTGTIAHEFFAFTIAKIGSLNSFWLGNNLFVGFLKHQDRILSEIFPFSDEDVLFFCNALIKCCFLTNKLDIVHDGDFFRFTILFSPFILYADTIFFLYGIHLAVFLSLLAVLLWNKISYRLTRIINLIYKVVIIHVMFNFILYKSKNLNFYYAN